MIKYAAGFLILASCTPYREIEVEQNRTIEKERSPQKQYAISLAAQEYVGDRIVIKQAMKDGYISEDFVNLEGNGELERKIIYRNFKGVPLTYYSGTMCAVICINREGLVLYAETLPSKTSFQDKKIRIRMLNAAMGYKFSPSLVAAPIECAKINFVIENNTLGR